MLPMDAQRNTEAYSYPNGMLNAAYLTGVLRKPQENVCFIQQTRNENHMLPVHFDPKKTPLPRTIREGDLVSAICHVDGEKQGDTRIVKVRSLKFSAPNVMHMDPRYLDDVYDKWRKEAHAAAPDSGVPDSIRELEARLPNTSQSRVDALDWRVLRMNQNSGNHVRLAGFVQARSLEQKRTGFDGKPLNDRLVLLLRQTLDADRCISIRWYGKNLEPLASRLKKGMGIMVQGEFRLDVKAIGAPDPESGIAPVSTIPFIQAKDYPEPVAPGSEFIKAQPSWAYELYLSQATGRPVSELGRIQEDHPPAAANGENTALFASAFRNQRGDAPTAP